MRILIHSNGPMENTGYGVQTRLLLPRLKELGHTPIVSAFAGLHGSAITWDGTPILPSGQMMFGWDMVAPHARISRADLVLFLCDFRELRPAAAELRTLHTAAWLPIDTAPLSKPEAQVLAMAGARPIAMSRFGQAQLAEHGYADPLYVPHSVDTEVYKPLEDRDAARAELGWSDRYVIGINAANSDTLRKGWPEQFTAFAAFRKHHPEALLAIHTIPVSSRGLNLPQLADDMGIGSAVWFPDPYQILAGNATFEDMAQWYSMLDLLSCCSYGEGFGVPIIEAQACGTPVVATRGSAMTELNPLGSLADGTPYWNPVHRAWWTRPDVGAITDAYMFSAQAKVTEDYRRKLVKFAQMYDTRYVAAQYWAPALEELADRGESNEGIAGD